MAGICRSLEKAPVPKAATSPPYSQAASHSPSSHPVSVVFTFLSLSQAALVDFMGFNLEGNCFEGGRLRGMGPAPMPGFMSWGSLNRWTMTA